MNEEKEYIETHCKNCKNKDTYLCCIRRTVDNKVKCADYEEKE